MATYKVKLAPRAALRKLKREDSKVKLNPDSGYDKDKVYTTRAEDFIDDVIYIKELGLYIDYKYILELEYPVSRFTPDVSTFMEIDWED